MYVGNLPNVRYQYILTEPIGLGQYHDKAIAYSHIITANLKLT